MNEIEAIIHYLEFHIKVLVKEMEPHVVPDKQHLLKEHTYDILKDIENTLSVQYLLDSVNKESNK